MSGQRRTLLVAAAGLALALVSAGGQAQIAIPDGLTHEHVADPGDEINGEVVVLNTSEETVEITIQLRDYLFFADGTTEYAEPGSVARSNAAWIELFAIPPLVIAPGSQTRIDYTIAVPEDESLVGTYWSILLVAPAVEPAPESEGLTITTVLRYGIQLVTHIGDSGTRSVQATAASLEETGEGVLFTVDLENDGDLWVRPDVWVELYAPSGADLGIFPSQPLRIFPGTSVRHSFPLGGLSPGRYKALVLIDDQGIAAWAAQYSLNITDDDR
jgi:hypothetical protein